MRGGGHGAGPGRRGWLPGPAPLLAALVALLPLALGGLSREAAGQEGLPGLPALTGEGGLTRWGAADFRWRIRPLEEGEAVSLESYRGKVLFINLWASWCPPCVREMGSIQRLRDRLEDTGITFLLVAAEGEAPVRRFLRRYPMDLPIYLEDSRMPASWGVRGLPTTWVVDRDGGIVLLRHGEAVWDTDAVEAFLRRVAEGVEGG